MGQPAHRLAASCCEWTARNAEMPLYRGAIDKRAKEDEYQRVAWAKGPAKRDGSEFACDWTSSGPCGILATGRSTKRAEQRASDFRQAYFRIWDRSLGQLKLQLK
jgi:hypothetical protein